MIDAGSKIYRTEGVSGLYRGFWVNSIQIFSGLCYIGTYEGVRHVTGQYNLHPQVRTLIAGGAASLVGQTIIVPFDVISQHLMLLGLIERNSGPDRKVSKFEMLFIVRIVAYIIKKFYRTVFSSFYIHSA